MTKTYPPVMRSQLADELNQAFASAEPHKISSAIGQALKDFNVSEKRPGCRAQAFIERLATTS
ncbi:hypothetical protein [Bradyrhizobium sp. CCBAU 11357]|uniref:hypothetical protein n=1 Tax=Bradyrhizobium sp. CCBAU 11357 TaxID=1630808 RepID=UPI0023045305|nr:hypothetical protein [Bradyrhizobium sp. CCBAU 11357]